MEVVSVVPFNLLQRCAGDPAGALPSIFTGVARPDQGLDRPGHRRLLASSEGIGYLMVECRQMFQLDLVIVSIW